MHLRIHSAPLVGLLLALVGGCNASESDLGAVPFTLGDDKRIESVSVEGTYGGTDLASAPIDILAFLHSEPGDTLFLRVGTNVTLALHLSKSFELSKADLRTPATLHADCTNAPCPVEDLAATADAGAPSTIVSAALSLQPRADDRTSMRLDLSLANGEHVTVHAVLPHDAEGALLPDP